MIPAPFHLVPATATITVGATQFVFALPKNWRASTWSSSDPAIATIDPLVDGAIHGIAAGTVTITARRVRHNQTATMILTVIEAA